MVKEVPYNEYLKEVEQHLKNGGVFLTSGSEKANTMAIGWGGVTVFWGKPIFIVPVRKSRYTHQILEDSNEFTVSIPMNRNMGSQLTFCGTRSGRDCDKYKECGLTPVPGQKVKVPIIGECNLHYECRVVYKQDINPDTLDPHIIEAWYPDYHTLYFGEILACYLTE